MVVSCYGLAFSGGFTNSLIAMDRNSYLQSEGGPIQYGNGVVPASAHGNPINPLPQNVIQPSIGKYIGFVAIIYFIGKSFYQGSHAFQPFTPHADYHSTPHFIPHSSKDVSLQPTRKT